MSNQTIAISDFRETLTMWGLVAKLILLKMYNVLMNDSIMSGLMGM